MRQVFLSLLFFLCWGGGITASTRLSIDYSYAGYRASEITLPDLTEPACVVLIPNGKDDTRNIQNAVDALAECPMNENGFRGIIRFSEGVFRVSESVNIRHSGILFQGKGKRTEIRWCSDSRDPLFVLCGEERRFVSETNLRDNAPVGTAQITVNDASKFTCGQRITIMRPATAEWIAVMKADTARGNFAKDRIHWRTGQRNVYWDRRIVAISESCLSLDAPLTLPLEHRYGGAEVGNSVIEPVYRVGWQDMKLVGGEQFSDPADEEHSWIGIWMDAAEDVWVKNVDFECFCASAVRVGRHARRVTIEDCASRRPVCENIGYRNQAFYVEGQQVLVKDCRVVEGRNDYVAGLCAAGPNVFLNCISISPKDDSGAWESFSVGTLFEGLDMGGGGLFLTFDETRTQGACWTAANSVVWNCRNGYVRAEGHPWAPNTVIEKSHESLFASLLKKRIGRQKTGHIGSVPSQLALLRRKRPSVSLVESVSLLNGRFVLGGRALLGGSVNDAWWLGRINADSACTAGVSVTRFLPGRYGHGTTEDIALLVDSMKRLGNCFYESGPGLWYDRRRDDHIYHERTNAYVWAPFYELPWARTGRGRAWDGTSLYDLETFNPWYFRRVKELAKQCDEQGIVLFHSLFNTHNLLEIAPHWCDYPARPVNCVNATQLPEPMPLEPRGRIHLANEYYSIKDTALIRLHRLYIEKVLDELGGYENIYFCVGFQYSGPLDFLEFFHQTVADWEKKSRRKVKLLLRTGKEFTDKILQNPEFADQVVAIDTRYWQYRPDGSLFAPRAGQNMAYREMIGRAFKGYGGPMPSTTPYQAYIQIREYTDKYPEKAIIGWKNEENILPVVMAGAAQVIYRNPTAGHDQRLRVGNRFDGFFNKYLAEMYHWMRPVDGCLQDEANNWAMCTRKRDAWLLYSLANGKLYPLFDGVRYKHLWYQPEEGIVIQGDEMEIRHGKEIKKPDNRNWLLLLKK